MEFLMRSDSEAVTRAHAAITSKGAAAQAPDGANAKFVQLALEDEADLLTDLNDLSVGESGVLAMIDLLAERVQDEQAHLSSPGRQGNMPDHTLPLLSLDARILAAITVREAIAASRSGAGEPRFNRVAGRIGSEARLRLARLKENADARNPALGLNDLRVVLAGRRQDHGIDDALNDFGLISALHALPGGSREWKGLGNLLLWRAATVGILGLEQPTGRELVVRLGPDFVDALKSERDPAVLRLLRRPTDLPMLCTPSAWHGVRGGGWLSASADSDDSSHRHHLVKHHRHRPRIELLDAAKAAGRLDRVLRAANALQDTGWQLDLAVLEIQSLLASDSVGAFPGILGADDLRELRDSVDRHRRGMPEHRGRSAAPAVVTTETAEVGHPSHETEAIANNRFYESERARRDQVLLAMAMAVELRDRMDLAGAAACHLPVQLDLRGRVYAQPSLSPQGRDSVRALFRFSEGKELDVAARRWLAIHVANRYGWRAESGARLTLCERQAWTLGNDQRIRTIASVRRGDGSIDPHAVACILGPNSETGRWWRSARDPWQFLAACFEWADHEKDGFLSRLPIVLDGTANGLQHMSALCRDPAGAQATNVIPDPTSGAVQDCYWRISEVARMAIEDAVRAGKPQFTLAGKRFETRHLEPWLPHLDRRIAKEVAMKVPFGATARSTSDAILEVFDALPADARRAFPRGALAVSELNRLIWAATESELPAAGKLRTWLAKIAGSLARAGLGVEWSAPSGLSVLVERLNYGSPGENRTETTLADGTTIRASHVDETRTPCGILARKQKDGITAHLIHSIDAAHLVGTVNGLRDAGIDSVLTIHDAYGVHAANVETLRVVLRREFHRLHAEPVLLQFLDSQIDRVDKLVAGVRSGQVKDRLPNGLAAELAPLQVAGAELRALRKAVPCAKRPFDPDLILQSEYLFD